ncbi:MAG: N-acetylhexosamine 1-kinase [Firmicutes bacterium ADurb.Bin080]|nr:MAG: N-acetylhexosamine 1-kinase [Firmicutes bacterium ADurb.Bin080]
MAVSRYGCGHINDTYLVENKGGPRYILQRINHNVFKDVKGLMENIVRVTKHILERIKKDGGDVEHALRVIKTREGKDFFQDEEGNYYRLYNFIEGAVSIERRATPEEFRLSAEGFGRFQKMLDGFDADKLHETIKDFHNTRVRYENFLKAIEENKAGRRESVGDEIRFFMERKEYCGKIVDMLSNGQMPLRVTHNDTKLNNVLINIEEMKASTVIDLDTVMPGSIVYDFGDSIRSGANTGAEDEKDLDKVRFSLELFESYVKGFLKEVGERLTESEKENLAFGAIIMTYECGMRFLTDHLNGDVYFRIHRENHNLDRARTQMKMVTEMEGQFERMKEIVKDNLR